MCKQCKDDWQRTKNNKFECPNCKSLKQPKNVSRKELALTNKIKVTCSDIKCTNKDLSIFLGDFMEH